MRILLYLDLDVNVMEYFIVSLPETPDDAGDKRN